MARPRTAVMGNGPDTTIYQQMDQYTMVGTVSDMLVLCMDSPIYFANSGNMREWITLVD